MRDLYGGAPTPPIRTAGPKKTASAAASKTTPKKTQPNFVPKVVLPSKEEAVNFYRMGYHLQSDIKHDFGTSAPLYNINEANANTKVGAKGTSEDECVRFFLSGGGMGIIDNVKARMNREQVFPVPDKTASFKNWKAPILFGGGNDKVGIVQDAGEFITIRLGAQNVITFGSILDPAGKSIRAESKPIWFNPTENGVEILLQPFGFDPTIIQSIVVNSLTAGAVKGSYVLGKGREGKEEGGVVDAVGMNPITDPFEGQAKPINQTEVGSAGYFTSIAKAENIAEELTNAGFEPNAIKEIMKNKVRFYIGKTLGDAMLVASAMPNLYDASFQPTIPNPFVSLGAQQGKGQWKDWISGVNVPAPSVLILKTGDRLNWLRAIIFNVGAIYEDQAKDGRTIKQYRYFPGAVDEAAIITAIRSDFELIGNTVIERYRALAENIKSLNLNNTSFAPGGSKELTTSNAGVVNETHKIRAQELLNIIANKLIQETTAADGNVEYRGLCGVVLEWLAAKRVIANSEVYNDDQKLRELYNDTLKKANACSPQVNTPIIQKGNQEAYIAHKVIVADVPGDEGDWPLKNPVDIMLRNAFSRIKSNGEKPGETRVIVAETDIDRRFFKMLDQSLTGGGQEGGAVAYVRPDMVSFQQTVNETVKGFDPQEKELIGDVQTGGAYFSVEPANGMEDDETRENILMNFPRIRDFLKYMEEIKPPVSNIQTRFIVILDVVLRRESIVFHDPDLLNELVEEFTQITTEGYIQINTGNKQNVAFTSIDPRNPDQSTTSTVLFNAYAYNVDMINSVALFGPSSASSQDFREFEQRYLSKLPYGETRRGLYLKFTSTGIRPKQPPPQEDSNAAAEGPAAAGVGPGGGLRRVRPLYRNARTTAHLVVGTSDNEGLRERTGTRTTRRLRKSSRVTRRRR